MSRRELGQRVKIARKVAGLRQVDLAARAGISQSFLSELETGHVGFSATTAAALAAVLGLDPDDLLPSERKAVA